MLSANEKDAVRERRLSPWWQLSLEQLILLSFWHDDAEMLVARFGHDTAARRASDETELDKIGLVDFLDRLFFFADDGCDGAQSGRAAAEFLNDSSEHVAIGRLEAERIDFEQVERFAG